MDSLQAVQKSWQIASGDYIDVPAFGAPDDGDSLVWDAGSGAFVKATLATSAALAAHIADAANPHGVTAAQVGAYTIAQTDSAIAADVATHAALTSTHGVTTVAGLDEVQSFSNKTLITPTIASFANAAHTHQNAAGGAQIDHGLALTGLGDDDHTQYLLATGTRTGASSQAQTFTNGIKSPKIIAISDSTNAGGWYKADGVTPVVTVDTTDGIVSTSILEIGPSGSFFPTSGAIRIPNNAQINWATNENGTIAGFYLDSSNLFRVANGAILSTSYGGTNTIYVDTNNGFVSIGDGTTYPETAKLFVKGGSDARQLVVREHSTQTANLIEAQNSASTVQFAIGPGGSLRTNQATTNTNTPSGATVKQIPWYDTSGTLLGYIPVYGSAW